MKLNKKILIGLPRISRPLPKKLREWAEKTRFIVEITESLPQEAARSILVSKMHNENYDAIFFIDSDMEPEIIDLDKTIKHFYETQLPVISCLTSTRGPHHKLLLFKKNENISYPELDENMYRKDHTIPVYAIGFGGCLIRREVFDKIGLPWFRTNWDYDIPETGERRLIGGTGMGADFFFSLRCNAENIPMHIDCGKILHHKELTPSTHFYGRLYPDEYKMRELEKLTGVG